MLHAIPHLENFDRRVPAVRTTRPDFARTYLGKIFADHRLVLSGGAVDFAHQYATLCDTSVGLLRYGADVEVVAPALDFYLLQLTLGGEVGVQSAQFEATLPPCSVFVMNPGVAYRKYWARDARQLMIKIPRTRLEGRVTDTLESNGSVSDATPMFASRACAFGDLAGPLLRWVDDLCRSLSDHAGPLQDISARRALEDAILEGLLAAMPHMRSDGAGEAGRRAIPLYLRRAENHLRDNPARAVRMSELVDASGVSERTLQDAFWRHRGKTPGQFARELRLDRVRRALIEQPGNDDSVTKIALRFGFTHLGRFSRSYADRFGEYPSETLARKQTH